MPRAQSTFRQRDVTAAIRAAEAAGHAVERVEIDREGRIVVVLRPMTADDIETKALKNEWDQ
jgi:hypothetical protein